MFKILELPPSTAGESNTELCQKLLDINPNNMSHSALDHSESFKSYGFWLGGSYGTPCILLGDTPKQVNMHASHAVPILYGVNSRPSASD